MVYNVKQFCIGFGVLLGIFSCATNDDDYITLVPEEGEVLSGGDATSFIVSPEAFSFSIHGLSSEGEDDFAVGNSFFNQNWVTAPASTTARDGLGPFFNARSCSGCHFKDGRGRAPQFAGELAHGLLLRVSVPGTDAVGANLPEPVYGGQFQDNSILGIEKEGIFEVVYEPLTITYPDGEEVTLRKPTYTFPELKYGPMAANVQVSPRVANQMIGLGLLDAIPEATLLQFADEGDADGDGISGKANYVYDKVSERTTIGRFGWKANQPTLLQQVAAAFSSDLGISSSVFPDQNCTPSQNCDGIPNGGEPEISDENLRKVTFYSTTLAVPARRDVDDPKVLQGKQLFERMNCTGCHIPKIQTGPSPIAETLSNQIIRPYTDLLLHDMGEGLADNTPDFLANGREWRTQPLWGIGLIERVNGHTNLLHDGRARNVEEAILWHGGEAEASRQAFMALSREERDKVLTFINTL